MAYKKWIIADADKEKASVLSEKFNIDPFIAFLLVSRGVDTELAISDFLSSSFEFSDPFNFKDMDIAVERIEAAVEYGEKITVYGDYDCDGITSTALLVSLLRNMGADVDYYIPSREKEGYGLNLSAIDKIKASGTELIITVDNGIASVDEAVHISDLGLDLIITDHHQLTDVLPKALAVINPYRKENDIAFRDICGVGVAFKLACALYGDTDDMLYQYADLVAIGTIADVVPLLSENRGFVKAGLEMINSSARVGIDELKKIASGSEKDFSSIDTAFLICPRINACGRVDDASKAVELLLCEDRNKAAFLANQLNINNAHRQELEQEILDDVKRQIEENPDLINKRVIVIAGKGYHHGVVGIVASRVLEEYGKPVIIIGINEDGKARGSARSVDGFNMFEAVSYCSDLLIQFGGHPKAAGMGLFENNISKFREKINEYAYNKFEIMPPQIIKVDCKLSPFYLDLELAKSLSLLEPYGECNPRAVFALMGLTVNSVNSMGNGRHIRLECIKKGKRIRIVKFGTSAEEFCFKAGDKIDAAVRISENLYNGKSYLSVQAVDIRKNGVDEAKYFSEKTVLEQFLINRNNDKSVYPSRAVCSYIYKALKANGGWNSDLDNLYFSLSNVTYGQLYFAVKAFEESGLISVCGKKITVSDVKSKVDLMNTPLMKILKGRLNIE